MHLNPNDGLIGLSSPRTHEVMQCQTRDGPVLSVPLKLNQEVFETELADQSE